ncbi:hypothetical protein Pnap_2024 [Polaromonas naphthalenivorans CJ2]|uniref:Uncharacterized protein n=1 Tax=Polaromonas naphthalenivorans (strain CJ2) TaxID=365044 RepID=A1VNV5_POLNA|nr:hypothetical protein Pnap_2024 [Polaromonas naphthalenivorans CJ2]
MSFRTSKEVQETEKKPRNSIGYGAFLFSMPKNPLPWQINGTVRSQISCSHRLKNTKIFIKSGSCAISMGIDSYYFYSVLGPWNDPR